MELALPLRARAAAVVGLAAASLIAVTPVSLPSFDELRQQTMQLTASVLPTEPATLGEVISTVQFVIGQGINNIGHGIDNLALGVADFGYALQDFGVGADNIFVIAPQDLFVGLIDIIVGQEYDHILFHTVGLTDSLSGLINDLQANIAGGLNEISNGFTDLGQGVVNDGLLDIIFGLDLVGLWAPQNLLFDAVNILVTSL